MGGVLILLALTLGTLLWADLTNVYVWVVLLVTLGFGLIGFADDYLKLTKRSSGGLSGPAEAAGPERASAWSPPCVIMLADRAAAGDRRRRAVLQGRC